MSRIHRDTITPTSVTVVCSGSWAHAALLLGAGAALGLGVGLVAVRGLSAVLSARSGLLIEPHLGWPELHLVAAYFTLALLVALVPAALALTRPVTQELRR